MLSCFSCIWLFATLWTTAPQVMSMGFSRQEYWSGLPFSFPRDLLLLDLLYPSSCLKCLYAHICSLAVLANTPYTQLTRSSYFQCVCVCTVTQLCLTLCNPMDSSPPGSSVHGILPARILKWVTMPFSRGSSQPGNQTHVSCVSCIADGFFTHCAIVLFGFHDTLFCSSL